MSSSHVMNEIPAVFTMNVIRNNAQGDGRTDDIVSVRKEGQYFQLSYSNKPENLKHQVSLTQNDVYAHFQDVLTLLSADDEPFTHVQFNFPAVPSVMYKVATLQDDDLQEVIMKRFDALLSNWPVRA